MSSEESYLAILRYLTNEREPYAPGTEGNAKRKIRKAAACYVVRDGTLYYQRRQRDQQRFAELEVVLQAERRARLIRAAHLGPDGAHRTRLQTWQGLSQRYWWRGEVGPVAARPCREGPPRGQRRGSAPPQPEVGSGVAWWEAPGRGRSLAAARAPCPLGDNGQGRRAPGDGPARLSRCRRTCSPPSGVGGARYAAACGSQPACLGGAPLGSPPIPGGCVRTPVVLPSPSS